MKIKPTGFSIYIVISIIAFVALAFVLILPQQFELNEKQMREESIRNMKTIYRAVEQYMDQRQVSFTGDVEDLVKSGVLSKNFYVPGGKPDDRYYAMGNYQTGEIVVKPPQSVLDKYPDHVLPENW